MSRHDDRKGKDVDDPVVAGHETAEVQIGPAVRFLVGLGIAGVVVFFLVMSLYRFWQHAEDKAQPRLPALVESNHGRLPPEPRLQVTPLVDYEVFRATQDSLLNSYGWANRDSARVRIPIARAMELIAQRRLPARVGMSPGSGGGGIQGGNETPGGGMGQPGAGGSPGGEPTGRRPRGDLRLRPPSAPVVPVPRDSAHRSGGG